MYPTMITPYSRNGQIDPVATAELVNFYWENGANGIFACCMSSEIFHLSLEERISLARITKETADKLGKALPSRQQLSVVASGHTAESLEDQVYELNKIADTGIDAIVLITNRMDIANTGDDNWIRQTEQLIRQLPSDLTIGVYECPFPYSRELTPRMIEWMKETGRFSFIKDTCCDATILSERLEQLKGSDIKLFNANTRTLLHSLRAGGDGYCGVMGNFLPQLYAWLCDNYQTDPQTADNIQEFLNFCARVETMKYPCSAKYFLDRFGGVKMAHLSRNTDCRLLTDDHKSFISLLNVVAYGVYSYLTIS